MSELIVRLDQLLPADKQRSLALLFFMWCLSPATAVPQGLLQSIQSIVARDRRLEYMFPNFNVIYQMVIQLSKIGLLLVSVTTTSAAATVDNVKISEETQKAVTALFTSERETLIHHQWDARFRSELRPEFWIETTILGCSLFLDNNRYDIKSMKRHIQHLLHLAHQHHVASLLTLPSVASVDLVQYVAGLYGNLGMLDAAARIYESRLDQFSHVDDDESVRSMFNLCRGLGEIFTKLQKISEAIDSFTAGLDVYTKRFSYPEKVVAETYIEVAALLNQRSGHKDWEQAIWSLEAALEIFKHGGGSPVIEEAQTILNIAMVLEHNGQLNEASNALREASDIYRSLDKWSANLDSLQVLIWLDRSIDRLKSAERNGFHERSKLILGQRIRELEQVVNHLQ